MSSLNPYCPCGSKIFYIECCQPLHQGRAANSPEALMRSRYTAFYYGMTDYLLNSWHCSMRPASLDLSNSPEWCGLRILSSSGKDDRGKVYFQALYRLGKDWGFLQEQSEFLKEDGYWYYLSGKSSEGQLKPGRNDSCPCGSGRKYKHCCLTE